jgi:hypothetical protein
MRRQARVTEGRIRSDIRGVGFGCGGRARGAHFISPLNGAHVLHVNTPRLVCLLALLVVAAVPTRAESQRAEFRPQRVLLVLGYDHAPDRDDGHSAAADRTILQSLFGTAWIREHVVPVSGAYGTNGAEFDPRSARVMDAAWGDAGGWLDAHAERDSAIATLTRRWIAALDAGVDVWIKEGGHSDLTAAVTRRVHAARPGIATNRRVHVVQHSDWNESHTTPAALAYVKQYTDYIRIGDANRYLAVDGGDSAFQAAALASPAFGRVWRAAFDYYDPAQRLDFSDTGELEHILGLGKLDIAAFRERFLH